MNAGLLILLVVGGLIAPWLALGLAIAAMRRSERLDEAVHQLKIEVSRLRREQKATPPTGRVSVSETHESSSESAAATAAAPATLATAEAPPTAATPPASWEQKQAALHRVAKASEEPVTTESADAPEEVHELGELQPITTNAPPTDSAPAAATPATPPPLPPRKPEPEPRESWEQKLATKLPVWIGAVALALAGIFMVRYFAQQGLMGPLVRVCLAGAFGAGMIGVGELLRRRQANIAQGLAAAGVAVLYGTLLSAVQLHHLISPVVGFALMAVVTAAAVALSLRHGPFVALLGLVGGFLMPALLGARSVPAVQIFGFFLLLQIAMTVLGRSRQWWWLAALTMVGVIIWTVVWLAFMFEPADSKLIGFFLLVSVASFIIATLGHEEQRVGELRVEHLIAFPAVVTGLALMSWLITMAGFSLLEWSYMGLLGAGAMVLARLKPRYVPMVWLAAAAGVALLCAWGLDSQMAERGSRFGWIALGYGLLYGGGAFAAMWGSDRPATWARLSVLAALAYMLAAWFFTDPDRGLPWWVTAAAIAAAFAAAAAPVQLRRAIMPEGDDAMAFLTIGCCAFAALAVPMELERQWIAVAWGLEVALIAGASVWLKLPQLRWTMSLLAALVCIRLLLNPFVLRYPVGDNVIFNWLLYGYGVPAACLVAAGWLLRRDEPQRLPHQLYAAAAALIFAMITLMIRHGFHPAPGSYAGQLTLIESGTYPVAWLMLAAVMYIMSWRWETPALRVGSVTIFGLAMFAVLMGPGHATNPLWTDTPVSSTLVFNELLYVFGLPALLCAVGTYLVRRGGDGEVIGALDTAAGVLGLVTITMLLRHGFHPDGMRLADVTLHEWSTYAIVWGLLAGGVLWAGLRWRRPGALLGAQVLLGLSMTAALLGAGVVDNPLWTHTSVGSVPVLNWLLYLYAIPAAIALLAALWLRNRDIQPMATFASLAGMLLAFGLVTLEVRQAFHGAFLDGDLPTSAEWYAYSAAWIVFAAVLLAVGIVRESHTFRWASLAVMLASIIKVFIFDTAHLNDLWRVVSFLGLGVSLLLLAWVYQRFVFSGRDREGDRQDEEEDEGKRDPLMVEPSQ